MSWAACVQEARQHNPDLVAATEQLNQAKARKGIELSAAWPQISAGADADRSKEAGSSLTKRYSYGVSGRQLIFNGFKTSYDVRAAQANIEASQYNYDVVSSNVRLDLRTAFVNLLSAQEFLGVARDIAGRRTKELESVKLKYEGGSENKGSVLKSQANLAQAQYQVAQAERDIVLSQRQLARSMGWEHFVPMTVQGDLTVEESDRSEPRFEDMIEQVPFLRELTAQKEAARLGVGSARADILPAIYASADIGKSEGSWPPGRTGWGAGLSLSMPIFEGGLQQAQVAQARAAYGQAKAQERSGRDGVLFTLASTWTQMQNSIDTVGVQKQFLDASRERARISEAEYNSGLITFNDWIIIEDELVNRQTSFLGTKTNALVAQANWEQAKGVTLDE